MICSPNSFISIHYIPTRTKFVEMHLHPKRTISSEDSRRSWLVQSYRCLILISPCVLRARSFSPFDSRPEAKLALRFRTAPFNRNFNGFLKFIQTDLPFIGERTFTFKSSDLFVLSRLSQTLCHSHRTQQTLIHLHATLQKFILIIVYLVQTFNRLNNSYEQFLFSRRL